MPATTAPDSFQFRLNFVGVVTTSPAIYLRSGRRLLTFQISQILDSAIMTSGKTAPASPTPAGDPPAGESGVGRHFFGGWTGFSLWLGLFLVWLAYLTWQVVAYRPSTPPAGQKLVLPSRAQLALADGIWVIRLGAGGEAKAVEGLAGIPLPLENDQFPNQLQISQLKDAIDSYLGENGTTPPTGNWLVPVAKTMEIIEKPGEKTSTVAKSSWKVAPLPPDPMRMRGGPGVVYPDTPFNRSLMVDWWSKGRKNQGS